jgi:putative hydroxymethylpyrimidine transport system substrate-binding protein
LAKSFIKTKKEAFMKILAVAVVLLMSSVAAAYDELTLMLDWFPNPNHIPIYVALEEGFFKGEGINLKVVVPSDPADPTKLAAAGKVDLAITTQINLIVARSVSLEITAVGALIQHPLGGLMALADGIESLSDLKGKKIGYALEPMEPVLWTAMLESVGLTPGDYELINVGFNTVPVLLAGKVDAIGAFRNYEKIKVELLDYETVFFPMEEHGIPDNYELIFIAAEGAKVKTKKIKGFLKALAEGIDLTLKDPNRALDTFFDVHPQLKDELNWRAFLATLLLFVGSPCHNVAEKWVDMQDFLFERGLIERKAPLEKLFTEEFLPKECF